MITLGDKDQQITLKETLLTGCFRGTVSKVEKKIGKMWENV
jgi:hypothetical protein